MARYSNNNLLGGTQQNLSSSFKTILSQFATTGATTLRRGWITEASVGQDGAPNSTDCTVVWSWDRMTADGTGTTLTPPPQETSDAAALLTYKGNYTAEGTITAATTLYTKAINQRGDHRWVALDAGSYMVSPATNNAGIVVRAKSATFTSTVIANHIVLE